MTFISVGNEYASRPYSEPLGHRSSRAVNRFTFRRDGLDVMLSPLLVHTAVLACRAFIPFSDANEYHSKITPTVSSQCIGCPRAYHRFRLSQKSHLAVFRMIRRTWTRPVLSPSSFPKVAPRRGARSSGGKVSLFPSDSLSDTICHHDSALVQFCGFG